MESQRLRKKKKCVGESREAGREKDIGRGDREKWGDVAERNLLWFPFSGRGLGSKWRCEIFRKGPGTETPALGDVTQLQCWNGAHRTLL